MGRGITVNAVTPGFVDTDMTQALTAEQRAAALKAVPMGRVASAREIATAVGVFGFGRGRVRHGSDAASERRHVHVTQHSNGAK